MVYDIFLELASRARSLLYQSNTEITKLLDSI